MIFPLSDFCKPTPLPRNNYNKFTIFFFKNVNKEKVCRFNQIKLNIANDL